MSEAYQWEAKAIDGEWRVGLKGNLDTVHDATITVHKHGEGDIDQRIAEWVADAHNAEVRAPSPIPAAPSDAGNHDCLAKRRPDEPMFILLGRDPDAHNIVRQWAERRLAAGGAPEHCQMGLDTAARMKAYAADPSNAPASAPPASAYAAPSDVAGFDHLACAVQKMKYLQEETRETFFNL